MSEIAIYMKVFGLAEDERGNKDYAGMKLSMGEFKEGSEIPYEELIKKVHIDELPKILRLDGIIKPEDIEIITPEEYDRDYGGEDDNPDLLGGDGS